MSEWPAALDRGLAEAAHAGETCSGDLAVLVPTAAGALAAVIDGLGHGPEAAEAAATCAAVVTRHAEAAPQDLLQACHDALLKTRGAVMTAVWFDLERERISWAGVGNVLARLVHAGPQAREDVALVFGGVLGYRMPRVRPATMGLERGDLLVMTTDGVEDAISPALAGGGSAQTLADRILTAHGRGSDDALALVVRYR
ncbi:MAG TPA: SpoIIE family protein phosphatase [Solirubrobacter sp.]|nr:SpoIIE family protein phosphatase [Solirubrobacter sp.]